MTKLWDTDSIAETLSQNGAIARHLSSHSNSLKLEAVAIRSGSAETEQSRWCQIINSPESHNGDSCVDCSRNNSGRGETALGGRSITAVPEEAGCDCGAEL